MTPEQAEQIKQGVKAGGFYSDFQWLFMNSIMFHEYVGDVAHVCTLMVTEDHGLKAWRFNFNQNKCLGIESATWISFETAKMCRYGLAPIVSHAVHKELLDHKRFIEGSNVE